MEIDAGTIAIIQLAWARLLGLKDTAFTGATGRLLKVDEDAAELTFLRIFGTGVLRGPSWALDAAAGLDDEDLARHATLLRLTRENGGHGRGSSVLYYAEDFLEVAESASTVVSFERRHSLLLEAACPPDDIGAAGLSGLESQFVLLSQDSGLPLAGAGFDVRAGILAQLGALTDPRFRRQGLGAYITAVAVQEAFSEGLIPQWCAEVDNVAARRTAETLGFFEAGSQTSVLL